MKQKFHWQPDLALTITYWSITFFLFFFSLVMALERTRPYPQSILFTVLSICLMFIGMHRFLKIDQDKVVIYYARIWKKEVLLIQDITKIVYRRKHLIIKTKDQRFECMMSVKTHARFLKNIEELQMKQE